MPDLNGTTIAFLATDGVEQAELMGPWEAAQEAGATVHLISNVDEVQGFEHLDKGKTFPVDRQVAELRTVYTEMGDAPSRADRTVASSSAAAQRVTVAR